MSKRDEHRIGRRDLIKLTTGVGLAAGALGGFLVGERVGRGAAPAVTVPPDVPGSGITAYPRLKIGNVANLMTNKPAFFDYPTQGRKNLLVKLGAPSAGGVGPERDVVAFSTICTHMGCALQNYFNATHGVLGPCPCHFSTFDLALGGMPVMGSATEPLPQVTLEIDNRGDIFATGMVGLIYGLRNNLKDAPAL